MTILVTGAAGFIGYHVTRRLLAAGGRVVGIDNLNDYYDPALKGDRLAELHRIDQGEFIFRQIDFADHAVLRRALDGLNIEQIVHLGAQPGVRYSIDHPRAYVTSNLAGHLNVLELGRERAVRHLVYASSSSVYSGAALPFRVGDRVDHPISLYAATKKADELMSESYAHLYRLPQTGLRFFTVYGRWGRPDMAVWTFTRKILAGEPIQLFNRGRMRRDFTHIDDVAAGVLACLDHAPADDGGLKPGGSMAPHSIYNIGNNRPEDLPKLVALIEQAAGKAAKTEQLPMQPGDVEETFADIEESRRDLGFEPRTSLEIGVPDFVQWYKDRYVS